MGPETQSNQCRVMKSLFPKWPDICVRETCPVIPFHRLLAPPPATRSVSHHHIFCAVDETLPPPQNSTKHTFAWQTFLAPGRLSCLLQLCGKRECWVCAAVVWYLAFGSMGKTSCTRNYVLETKRNVHCLGSVTQLRETNSGDVFNGKVTHPSKEQCKCLWSR